MPTSPIDIYLIHNSVRVSLLKMPAIRYRQLFAALGGSTLSARPGLFLCHSCECDTSYTVQNAGCGHLHHAHCFRMNKDAKVGCPSGCPRDKFPREAAVFDPPTPHIVVVWDGDKIDK